jgi:hypothetical protein
MNDKFLKKSLQNEKHNDFIFYTIIGDYLHDYDNLFMINKITIFYKYLILLFVVSLFNLCFGDCIPWESNCINDFYNCCPGTSCKGWGTLSSGSSLTYSCEDSAMVASSSSPYSPQTLCSWFCEIGNYGYKCSQVFVEKSIVPVVRLMVI